jgi:hypothetical protein
MSVRHEKTPLENAPARRSGGQTRRDESPDSCQSAADDRPDDSTSDQLRPGLPSRSGSFAMFAAILRAQPQFALAFSLILLHGGWDAESLFSRPAGARYHSCGDRCVATRGGGAFRGQRGFGGKMAAALVSAEATVSTKVRSGCRAIRSKISPENSPAAKCSRRAASGRRSEVADFPNQSTIAGNRN